MVWIIFLLPVLVATLAFSVDIGKYYDDASQTQTVADSAALAGINALRRVFDEDTATMSAVCKAGFISEAVSDALTRMANGADAGGMGFDVDDVELIYCPRSSEPLVSGEGPCWVIPPDANCGVDCDCGGFAGSIVAYTNEDTVGKPGMGFYPLNSELLDSGEDEEDSAGYVYVRINKQADGYFSGLLGNLNFPSIEVAAMARHRFMPSEPCPGLFNPGEGDNDPKPISLKSSTIKIMNGGITISDDVTQDIHSSNPPNYIYADWIKILDNYSDQISYYCGPAPYSACIPDVVNSSEILNYEPEDSYLFDQYGTRNAYCNSTSYLNTLNPCDRYLSPTGQYIYVNCVIGPAEVALGAYTLYAGTYCGGLKIENVGGTADLPMVILKPRVTDGEITDDVFYLMPRDRLGGDNPREDLDGFMEATGVSYIEARNNDVADGGVIIYAPQNATGSQVAIDLRNTWLTATEAGEGEPLDQGGSLRIHADNVYLEYSRLEYTTYSGGSGCSGSGVTIPPFSGLVQ